MDGNMKANKHIGAFFSSMRNNHQGYMLKPVAEREKERKKPIVRLV